MTLDREFEIFEKSILYRSLFLLSVWIAGRMEGRGGTPEEESRYSYSFRELIK